MRNSLQLSSKESGKEDVSEAEQNKLRKRNRNSDDEYCTKKQKKQLPTYQNQQLGTTNNSFMPRRDLNVENAETISERNSTKTPETNENPDKGRPSPIVLTSEAKLVKCDLALKQTTVRHFNV
jgi:hypothetical protein